MVWTVLAKFQAVALSEPRVALIVWSERSRIKTGASEIDQVADQRPDFGACGGFYVRYIKEREGVTRSRPIALIGLLVKDGTVALLDRGRLKSTEVCPDNVVPEIERNQYRPIHCEVRWAAPSDTASSTPYPKIKRGVMIVGQWVWRRKSMVY